VRASHSKLQTATDAAPVPNPGSSQLSSRDKWARSYGRSDAPRSRAVHRHAPHHQCPALFGRSGAASSADSATRPPHERAAVPRERDERAGTGVAVWPGARRKLAAPSNSVPTCPLGTSSTLATCRLSVPASAERPAGSRRGEPPLVGGEQAKRPSFRHVSQAGAPS
jgi:hypothetical protein